MNTKTTSRLLGTIVVMQALTLLGQWTATPSLSTPALAANPSSFPDPGARQVQMVEELKALNGKMDRLLTVLESGKLQVQAVEPDEKK